MSQNDLQKKLGLVLSGGGARGLSHIGALKVLESEGIQISCISGCSMGGIVGALYALGLTVKEIEEIAVKHMTLRELVNLVDRTPRRRGLIVGHRLRNLLSKYIGSDTTFQDTKIPLVLNAVDLISSKEIALSEGNLLDAVMATCAIPAVFAPVNIGNMQLIDGGMLNNLPVNNLSIFNNYDVSIAIDVHPDIEKEVPWQFSEQKPRWPMPIPDYFLDFYRTQLIMSTHLADFYLQRFSPDLFLRMILPSEITTFYGYHRAAEIIAFGESSTRQRLDEINRLLF